MNKYYKCVSLCYTVFQTVNTHCKSNKKKFKNLKVLLNVNCGNMNQQRFNFHSSEIAFIYIYMQGLLTIQF